MLFQLNINTAEIFRNGFNIVNLYEYAPALWDFVIIFGALYAIVSPVTKKFSEIPETASKEQNVLQWFGSVFKKPGHKTDVLGKTLSFVLAAMSVYSLQKAESNLFMYSPWGWFIATALILFGFWSVVDHMLPKDPQTNKPKGRLIIFIIFCIAAFFMLTSEFVVSRQSVYIQNWGEELFGVLGWFPFMLLIIALFYIVSLFFEIFRKEPETKRIIPKIPSPPGSGFWRKTGRIAGAVASALFKGARWGVKKAGQSVGIGVDEEKKFVALLDLLEKRFDVLATDFVSLYDSNNKNLVNQYGGDGIFIAKLKVFNRKDPRLGTSVLSDVHNFFQKLCSLPSRKESILHINQKLVKSFSSLDTSLKAKISASFAELTNEISGLKKLSIKLSTVTGYSIVNYNFSENDCRTIEARFFDLMNQAIDEKADMIKSGLLNNLSKDFVRLAQELDTLIKEYFRVKRIVLEKIKLIKNEVGGFSQAKKQAVQKKTLTGMTQISKPLRSKLFGTDKLAIDIVNLLKSLSDSYKSLLESIDILEKSSFDKAFSKKISGINASLRSLESACLKILALDSRVDALKTVNLDFFKRFKSYVSAVKEINVAVATSLQFWNPEAKKKLKDLNEQELNTCKENASKMKDNFVRLFFALK